MTDKASRQEIQAFLKAAPDTQQLEVLAPDMNGILRGKRVGPDDFEPPFDSGLNYCASSMVMDTKGRSFERIIHGNTDGDPDVIGHAVAGSLAPIPWAMVPAAQILLELSEPDGTPYWLDPRNVLRRAAQPLTDLGLHPVIATELEFYLVEHDGEEFLPKTARMPGSDLPQDGYQYGTMDDLVDIDPFLTELSKTCEVQNIPAGAALSEHSPGQFEVNLHHVNDPARACDHAVLLKRAVKDVALKHDLAATFMAKPFQGIAGCGLHIHISLLDDDGRNVFAGTCSDGKFSETLRHAIGGMAAIMNESTAIFSPNANSFRRFALNCWVPKKPNWGVNHRDLALRIPLSSPENTRVEHRVAGADANPYLVVAAMLAGIHHGIINKCDPGVMVQPGEEVDETVTLPVRWELALNAFDAGRILPQYFGKYHEIFASCRREECDRFHTEVTNRDYEWYLRAV
jgi:glutamine synthetase